MEHFEYELLTGPKVEREGELYTLFGVNGKVAPITQVQRRYARA